MLKDPEDVNGKGVADANGGNGGAKRTSPFAPAPARRHGGTEAARRG